MTDILLTNDDAVFSPGLLALRKAINDLGNVVVVSTLEEQSWRGKAVSRFGTVNLEEVKLQDGSKAYAVGGTPADAVLIGIFNILQEKMPDVLISGINIGANIGSAFILSSATVGAAFESALMGIPSIAVSLSVPRKTLNEKYTADAYTNAFSLAAEVGKEFLNIVLHEDLPPDVDLLVINVPFSVAEDTPIKITTMARMHYGSCFEQISHKTFQFSTKKYQPLHFHIGPETDIHALTVQNQISVTPLSLDLTRGVKKLQKLLSKSKYLSKKLIE